MIETGGLDKGFDKNLNSRLPLRLMCGLFQSAAAQCRVVGLNTMRNILRAILKLFQRQYRRFSCNIKTVLVSSAYVHTPTI